MLISLFSDSDRPALIHEEKIWSYQEVREEVESFELLLTDLNIKSGSKVAFIADPTPASIFLILALFRLQAIACPLSHRIPEAQIPSLLNSLSASSYVTPSSFLHQKKEKSAQPLKAPLFSSKALATFLPTSGSNGLPKIVCHDFGNHYFSALGAISSLRMTKESKVLLSLPLFHVSGIAILFRTLLAKATLVLSANPLVNTLTREKITHLSLVPTQLYTLLDAPREHLCSLRCILIGGAPIPPSLLAENSDLPIFTSFGMTEASSMITLNGKPLPFRKVTVSESGEIMVKGRVLFRGYWEEEKWIPPYTNFEKWFPTGDLGKWDEGGLLQILGRKDRQFISGGENIQPEEIERVLLTIPGIKKAFVAPIADERFGQRPVAFLDLEQEPYPLSAIHTLLKTKLPKFKHPIHFFPYSAISPTIGMKPTLSQVQQFLLKNFL